MVSGGPLFRTINLTVAVAPVPTVFPRLPGTTLVLENSSFSSTVSTSKSSGREVLIRRAFSPAPVAAGRVMALSSCTYLRSVMLVERFLLEGRDGFAEALNIMRETGLGMVVPVDAREIWGVEKSGCHCWGLCRVSAGEPGDGGELDCEVAGVALADMLNELGRRPCPWALLLRLRPANWSVGAAPP